jgi:hypothetical protein
LKLNKGIKETSKKQFKPLLTLDDAEKRPRSDTPTSSQYQAMNIDDLLNTLKHIKSLHDEADIIHYLYEIK